MTNESGLPRLAVLIDADNASPKIADGLFREVAKLGYAHVRRIYGDFSGTQAKGWGGARVKHAIVPHQQFANVPGKNATDIALVVDAMDLLHSGGLDGFCIVSSDSDFTRLATRIREHGLAVFGFGRKEAAESFRQACWLFVDTDTLIPKAAPKQAKAPAEKGTKAPQLAAAKVTPIIAPIAEAERLILRALGETDAGRGWIAIETVHQQILKLDSMFKPKAYGCSKLSVLVDKIACMETKTEGAGTKMRMKPKSAEAAKPKAA